MTRMKPCLVCGVPSPSPRCPQHKVADQRPSRARRPATGSQKARLRRATLARDSWTCRGCGVVDRSGRSLQADHIIPLSLGGTNDLENMQALCVSCHSQKSKAEQAEAAERAREMRRADKRWF